jgi:hypothetical protein
MASISIDKFASDSNYLAMRTSSEDLRSILDVFGVTLAVPQGAAALVDSADRRTTVLHAGEKATGEFAATVVKTCDIPLEIAVPDAVASNALEVNAQADFVFTFGQSEHDLEAVRDNLLKDTRTLTRKGFEKAVSAEAASFLREFVKSHTADELYEPRIGETLLHEAKDGLKRTAFQLGVDLRRIDGASFRSDAHDEALKARRDAEIEEQFLELARKKEAKKEEIEAFKRELEKKHLLHKKEINALKLEEKLERARELEKAGMDPALALIEDKAERAKMLRYKLLSPEKIKVLEEAARAKGLRRGAIELVTRRILTAQGKAVIAHDPKTPRPGDVRERYDFSGGALGHLRSVRIAEIDGRPVLLAGAQGGVYVQELESGGERFEYKFPGTAQSRGGANSAEVAGGYLYATHSDYGLVQWPIGREDHGRRIFEDLTKKDAYCRGVQKDADGALYFTSGAGVFRTDADAKEKPVEYTGSTAPITSLAAAHGKWIFAANSEGRIIRWSKSEPGSCREEPLRKGGSIYMLKLVTAGGAPFLLVGSKEYALLALDAESGETIEFHAPEMLRWVDGAHDYVFASNRAGTRVFVWESDNPRKPVFDIRMEETVHDLTVWTEKAEG